MSNQLGCDAADTGPCRFGWRLAELGVRPGTPDPFLMTESLDAWSNRGRALTKRRPRFLLAAGRDIQGTMPMASLDRPVQCSRRRAIWLRSPPHGIGPAGSVLSGDVPLLPQPNFIAAVADHRRER